MSSNTNFFTITGFEPLNAHVNDLATNLRKNIQDRTTKTMQQGAQRIKNDSPVRTGNLRNSVRFVQGGAERGMLAQIKIEAGYAGYVEFGTFKMMGRNFVSPNFHYILSQLRSFI